MRQELRRFDEDSCERCKVTVLPDYIVIHCHRPAGRAREVAYTAHECLFFVSVRAKQTIYHGNLKSNVQLMKNIIGSMPRDDLSRTFLSILQKRLGIRCRIPSLTLSIDRVI